MLLVNLDLRTALEQEKIQSSNIGAELPGSEKGRLRVLHRL